jgi:cell division protein FtsL
MSGPIRLFKESLAMRSGMLARIRSHRYFPITMLALAFLVASCVHVWQRFQVFELVDEVADLKHEQVRLVDEARKLQSDIASLSLSTRIEQYATDSLGLHRLEPDHLFTLETKDPSGKPPDKLESLKSAVSRIASHMPVVVENRATARENKAINLDSLQELEGGR